MKRVLGTALNLLTALVALTWAALGWILWDIPLGMLLIGTVALSIAAAVGVVHAKKIWEEGGNQ